MLGMHPVDVMLLATDLGVARRFSGDTSACRCCWKTSSSSPSLWRRQPAGGHPQHHRNHRGGDQGVLAGGRPGRRVAWLRARGVQLRDLPELDTIDGIADIGFALAAWFIDPHHNWIGLLQLKDPGVEARGAATGATQAEVSDSPGAEP